MLAALLNALKVVGKELTEVRIAVAGSGAAGTAIIKILLDEGAARIVAWDRAGVVYRGRTEEMGPMQEWLAERTNPEDVRTVEEAVS